MNLAEIKERESKATAGPWAWGESYFNVWLGSHLNTIVGSSGYDDGDSTVDVSEENAEFIAHAREDVPALIAEVERLEKESQKYFEQAMRLHEALLKTCDALGADIEDYLGE